MKNAFSATGPLRGTTRVPGDKSISHRTLLLAALADGTSHVRGLSRGDDVLRMREAIRSYGVKIEGDTIAGGRERLVEPTSVIDVGNSGTAMRLLSGFASSLPFLTVLVGDESIHRRPMDRVVVPLQQMGAHIEARENGRLAPLCIRGGALCGIDYATPVPSAQVKGAILFAGLGATGETIVREAVASRRHTEELFAMVGVPTISNEEGGKHVVHLIARVVAPFTYDVPGDPSQAAFFAVAASIVEGSEVRIENVYVGPGRAGFVDVLHRMGADIEVEPTEGDTANLVVRSARLTATDVSGKEIVGLIDEVPILAVAAAFATGTTRFLDAGELRVKESDRIATMAMGLRAIGVDVEEQPDALIVHGGSPRGPGTIASMSDHRVAMSFAIAALGIDGELTIDGFESVETSWPGFASDVDALCR